MTVFRGNEEYEFSYSELLYWSPPTFPLTTRHYILDGSMARWPIQSLSHKDLILQHVSTAQASVLIPLFSSFSLDPVCPIIELIDW